MYIPLIENLSFRIACVKILGAMEFWKTINDFLRENSWKNNIKLNKYHAEKFIKKTDTEIRINIGVETCNFQWNELIFNIFEKDSIQVEMKKYQNFIHI